MIKFNQKNKKSLTYDEALSPAMKIVDQSEADQYLKEYISYIQKYLDKDKNTNHEHSAEYIAKTNLGYFAGYYSDEVRKQVESLFNCTHPIFGSIKNGSPTVKEAFELGKNMAKIKKL